jgi:hypothetical protein
MAEENQILSELRSSMLTVVLLRFFGSISWADENYQHKA